MPLALDSLSSSIDLSNKEAKIGSVKVRFKFEVAFMNEQTPAYFQRRPVYICCLTETSDGRLIDFRRTRLLLQDPI